MRRRSCSRATARRRRLAGKGACEQPPLKGHVTITGYVDSARKIDLYADATMLVLPSYEEGFGLPVLEAMACGVPVIVSTRGSLPEVAGAAAEPIDPDDAEGFARAMAALIAGDAARGDRARRGASREIQLAGVRRRRASRVSIGDRGPCASPLTRASSAAGRLASGAISRVCSTAGRGATRCGGTAGR